MLPECTPAVERSLQAATERAHRRGAGTVESADLLVGLVAEEEGRAADLLRRAGAEPAAVRELLAVTPGGAPTATSPPLGEAVHRALKRAHERSTDNVVDSAQLLAALFAVDPVVSQVVEPLGLTPAALEALMPETAETPVPLDEPLQLLETTECIDTARILDANANRAREALRVVEDYCRFVLDDTFLSGELKRLRHDLTDALSQLSAEVLLQARDTQGDVGTTISTAREGQRHSLDEVVQANLKRLQEALRSLEEYGKLHGGEIGAQIEQLRYRSYTLERALLLGADARRRLADARVYVLLTGSQCVAALDWTIRECAAGGVRVVQLREKQLNDRELLERARNVRRWTREAGVLFIMNDRPDIARLVEADGVHVGQDELPVREVRRIVGPDAIIGVSTHNLDQLRQAILDGASYVGVGPTFRSGTKDFADLAGLEYVRQAVAETSLPAFVIGGVTLQNIGQAIAAGARRVAVSAAICQADEPQLVAAELMRWLNKSPSGDVS
jgi:thiamine-phosphate pyrophosphorylase